MSDVAGAALVKEWASSDKVAKNQQLKQTMRRWLGKCSFWKRHIILRGSDVCFNFIHASPTQLGDFLCTGVSADANYEKQYY